MGEGKGREEEGSKQETTERASSRCSENTSRLRSRWVAVCVEMKQGVGGRAKNKHTLFACHPLTSPSRPCSPRPYWGRGGRKWEEDSSPSTHPLSTSNCR